MNTGGPQCLESEHSTMQEPSGTEGLPMSEQWYHVGHLAMGPF